jgi:hypothetical protein
MATRDKWVHIKVSVEERQAWQAQAEAEGITLADLIRSRLATTTVGREPRRKRPARRADPALVAALGRIGNNLNQISRWANTYKKTADTVAVLGALVALERAVEDVAGGLGRERHSPGGAAPEPGHEPGYPGGPSHPFSIAQNAPGAAGADSGHGAAAAEDESHGTGLLPSLLPLHGQGGKEGGGSC